MKHYHWYKLLISAFMTCVAKISLAGAASSGGGAAVVCRNNNNQITYARLLDLFESNARFGHTVLESNQNATMILNQILGRLEKNSPAQLYLREIMTDTINSIHFLPAGVSFSSPEDLGTQGVIVLDGCQIEGIGSYEGNKLLVSRSIYDAFSETDKAAFIAHEAVYFVGRKLGGLKDSQTSRKLTGELFATDTNDQDVENSVIKFLGYQFDKEAQTGDQVPLPFLTVNDVKRDSISLKFEAEEIVEKPYRVRVYCVGTEGDSDLSKFEVRGGEVNIVRIPTVSTNKCLRVAYTVLHLVPSGASSGMLTLSTNNVAEPTSVEVNFEIYDAWARENGVPWFLYQDIVLPALPK